MSYLVVAYPQLEQSNYDWIQAYRKVNDQRYFSIVDPHFTIVFAVSDISKEDFITEIKKQSFDLRKFDFEIRVATLNRDDSVDYSHEFLVPDTGYSNIIKIHDKLYSGILTKHLRLDLDFIPHIGIGNSDEAKKSKKRVDKLNENDLSIKGSIDSLDIIEYSGGPVKTLERIILKE